MNTCSDAKHIGIYIPGNGGNGRQRIKELLPYFSCKVTILTPRPLPKTINTRVDQIKLPINDRGRKMNAVSNFVCQAKPDLFYIDESASMAAFVHLLGVPYVYARTKRSVANNFGRQLAYALSLFNLAPYKCEQESEEFRKTPFYDKTKYLPAPNPETNKKLFCMYLEEQICLKKEKGLKPFLFEHL